MLRVAVLISGGGSNLQSLIDFNSQEIDCAFEITAVIADRQAEGLKRAEESNIPNWNLDRKVGMKALAEQINSILENRADYIVLAGFLSILDSSFIEKWKGQIINIHPALLPDFGGKGMFGLNVHKAVLESGAQKSGCTVHYVDAGIDTGEIISSSSLTIGKDWDANQLQREVLKLEHKLLPETVQSLCKKGI